MHDVALEAGHADVSQIRSSSLRTRVKDVGSSSFLVNTEWAFYPPGLGSARSGPAGGSSGTCYPSIPLQLPGASASSPPCITKNDEEPGCVGEGCVGPRSGELAVGGSCGMPASGGCHGDNAVPRRAGRGLAALFGARSLTENVRRRRYGA
jgi:hypothetical protein